MNQENPTKECIRCHKVKPLLEFYFRKQAQKYRNVCKQCFILQCKLKQLPNREQYIQRSKQWRIDNPQRDDENHKKWKMKNPNYDKQKSKQWNQEHPQQKKENDKRWYSTNKKHVNQYYQAKRQIDYTFKLLGNIRSRINRALQKNWKAGHTVELLGCTILEWKQHLEQQFTGGMSWNNYGNKTSQWSVDHIIPCSVFDLSDPVEQKQCFHYTNTQPMWHIDNIKKGNKILQMSQHSSGFRII